MTPSRRTVVGRTSGLADPTEFPSPRVAITVALLLAVLPYVLSLRGEFVYDDGRQIVDNHLIQDPRYFWLALRSDVWAFKAETPGAVSNYWRPGAVLWMIANHRLFGLNPAGWHATSIAAHAFVALLAWLAARKLGAAPAVAAAAAWVFAVHPAHVESVCWVSASPDLLIGIGQLAAYVLYLRAREPLRFAGLLLAALVYVTAMFSKETAVIFPLIVAGTEYVLTSRARMASRPRRARIALCTLPFVGVAAFYLFVRLAVIGMSYRMPPQPMGLLPWLVFVPQAVAFYLRQSLLPFLVAPMHSLRPAGGGASLWPVLSPAVVLVALVMLYRAWRRGALHVIAWLWFAAMLALPVINIRALPPDERVHDRYLYLGIFGLALGVAQRAAEWLGFEARGRTQLLRAALAASIALAAVSFSYSRAWQSEAALWQCAVDHDPNSPVALVRMAHLQRTAGRLDVARALVDRALVAAPADVEANIARGIVAAKERDFVTAEQCLTRVLAEDPRRQNAVDHLGEVYTAQRRFADAVRVFETARRNMPLLSGKYAFNIAVTYYAAGDLARAIAELEAARSTIEQSPDRDLLSAYVLLGELDARASRPADARQAFRRYLDLTDVWKDAKTAALRARAEAGLRQLEKPEN